MTNLVFIYYDQPKMLARQIETWNTYAGLPLKLILVDDGSPNYAAQSIVNGRVSGTPIEVYRITQDIRWNFSGARNLGCTRADGWIYVSDIDTLLPRATAEKFSLGLDMARFYLPRRVSLPEFRPMSASLVNLAFHRTKYDEIGGYDEDYASGYGREQQDFFERMSKSATLVRRDDVAVHLCPDHHVADARTSLEGRNTDRNTALYIAKRAAGYPKPAAGLRFTWDRVL